MAEQKVIAKRGETTYLIDIGDERGRILNTEEGILYPSMFLPSILARGYWEEAEVPDAELKKLLDGVEDRQLPPGQ